MLQIKMTIADALRLTLKASRNGTQNNQGSLGRVVEVL